MFLSQAENPSSVFGTRITTLLVLLIFGLTSRGVAGDISDTYRWEPMKIGGGGWVVGMDIHPTATGPKYVRTDVSGAYRWEPSSSSWKQIVTAESLPREYVAYGKYTGVDSLVSAPNGPDIAYMAYAGQIFRSTNRGEQWLPTSFAANSVAMEPNGHGRQEGERLAVDPQNSNIVYFGSVGDGLWRTKDAGITWERIESIPKGLPGHGVNTVVFDPGEGVLSEPGAGPATKTIYVTIDNEGVFQSKDAGATWTNIAKGSIASGHTRDAEMGSDGTYYLVQEKQEDRAGAVWKLPRHGDWQEITPTGKQGGSRPYYDIAVDPQNPDHLVVIRNGGWTFTSEDQGKNWKTHGFELKSSEIKWLGEQENYWLSVGEIAFAPNGELWFAEGFGVWWADDLQGKNIVWNACSTGIEETCGNDIISPPGGKPIGAMWDVGVFRFDKASQYTAQRAVPYFMSAWSLDWSPGNPQFIAAVFRNHLDLEPHINEAGFSTDGGRTWSIFPAIRNKELPADLHYGTIAISATSTENMMWAPAEGKLPYFTRDEGASWQQSSLGEEVKTAGSFPQSSPHKPLCADRVKESTFYLYHMDKGFFRSTDGGHRFAKTKTSPPLRRFNSVLKSVPGKAGHIFFAEGHQGNPVGGLWHSEDAGETWRQIPGIEQAFNVGLGKPIDEQAYPTIFVAGVANGETGIYRSTNVGNSWDKITEFPLGIFDWVDAMDGDKDTFGTIYLAFAQTGFAVGSLKQTEKVIPPEK